MLISWVNVKIFDVNINKIIAKNNDVFYKTFIKINTNPLQNSFIVINIYIISLIGKITINIL